jgi:hypothetical protein
MKKPLSWRASLNREPLEYPHTWVETGLARRASANPVYALTKEGSPACEVKSRTTGLPGCPSPANLMHRAGSSGEGALANLTSAGSRGRRPWQPERFDSVNSSRISIAGQMHRRRARPTSQWIPRPRQKCGLEEGRVTCRNVSPGGV